MRGKSLSIVLTFALAVAVGWSGYAAEYKIGYSSSNFNDTFQTYIVDAAKAWAAKNPGVTIDVMDAQEDVVRQQDQVSTFIQSGMDALIVVPVNTSAARPMVEAATEAGIPLIFVNRNPYPNTAPPPNVYFIGADSIQEGETQMNTAGEVMGGKGGVVILMGLLTNEGAVARTQGVKNVIEKKYPNIKILAEEAADWQRDKGMNVMENWLTAYGTEINAVLSNNDEMALGAALALDNAGRSDVVVYGVDAIVDALAAIEQGTMTGTVLQDPIAQGQGSIEMAVNILKGQKPAEQINKIPAAMITKKNVADYK